MPFQEHNNTYLNHSILHDLDVVDASYTTLKVCLHKSRVFRHTVEREVSTLFVPFPRMRFPLPLLPPSPFRNPRHLSCLGCLAQDLVAIPVMALCHKHAFVTRHSREDPGTSAVRADPVSVLFECTRKDSDTVSIAFCPGTREFCVRRKL